MPKGYVYILECSDGSYYTGSTVYLELRIKQHQNGLGANHTKKRLPVKLVYVQEFTRIDEAFNRKKQIQGWSRKKKEALIEHHFEKLPYLSFAYRDKVSSRTSDTTKASDTMTKNLNNIIFNSNGKLLLTGEYLVLDGALSLAIPTKYGQSLEVEPIKESKLIWRSLDEKGSVWFENTFEIINNKMLKQSRKLSGQHDDISNRLIQILNATKKLNPDFLNIQNSFKVTTKLDFPRDWGLGTSSTLINNIAQWAHVDAYKLLEHTFGGSGYDIACAQHNTPITYKLLNNVNEISQVRNDKNIEEVNFNPPFKNHLYFVYLNQKQNSRDGIAQYRNNTSDLSESISAINSITEQIISCKTLDAFILLIEKHENIISKIIHLKPVKERLFNDFNGGIKSLGAWGGDFILVATKDSPIDYFKKKGFETVIPYQEMTPI